MANTNDAAPGVGLGASGGSWELVWGVLLIAVGVLAVIMPGIAALATALVFAWMLIFGGGFEIAYAFQTRSRDGFGWKLASGVLTLVLGIAILAVPLAGVASLAFIGLLTGFSLIATGVWRIVLGQHASV